MNLWFKKYINVYVKQCKQTITNTWMIFAGEPKLINIIIGSKLAEHSVFAGPCSKPVPVLFCMSNNTLLMKLPSGIGHSFLVSLVMEKIHLVHYAGCKSIFP